MRIEVDSQLCQAYGNCLLAAPDVFELTESAPVVLVQPNPGDALRAQVEEAVLTCPVQALSVSER